MRTHPKKTVEQLFRERTAITEALQKGVRDALLRHKKLGQSIVVWRDGKVITLSPEQIEIPSVPQEA